jgi:threonine-phosphate decarboxylase
MSHGGRVYEAARELGIGVDEVLDFSANMNPYGPPESVMNAVRSAIGQIIHYPDPESHDLVYALACQHGVSPECIVVTNGAEEALWLLPQVLCAQKGIICSPSFSGYSSSMYAWHKPSVFVPSNFRWHPKRFESALYEAAEQVSEGDVLFVCNPNNPTAELAPRQVIADILREVRVRGGTLVLDESFMQFVRCEHAYSFATSAATGSALVVVRSLTKFYSIPGLRVGYVLMPRELAARMRCMLPHWNVNRLAQVAALAAVQDERYRYDSVIRLSQAKDELCTRLRELRVFRVHESSANFLLLEILDRSLDSRRLCTLARRNRVLLRDCADFPALSRRYIRVAVRKPAHNAQLIRVLEHIIRGE